MKFFTIVHKTTGEVLNTGEYNPNPPLPPNSNYILLDEIESSGSHYNFETKSFYDSNDAKNNEVRLKRDGLLTSTDWTQLGDSTHPGAKADWLAYRAALRDITKQEGFPSSVTWPTPPE